MRAVVLTIMSALIISCASENDPNKNTKKGAGIGAAVGAVAGAIVAGDNTKGAVLGGAIGAAAGGAYGKKLDEQAEELEKVAETKRTDKGIITKLKGDITFDSGSARLQDDAQKRIKEIADILKKYPENKITIVGHTDSTGSDNFNKELSKDRAQTVKSVLLRNGVEPRSMNTLGVGSQDPIASNSTSEGRSENRRVELAITMDEQKAAE